MYLQKKYNLLVAFLIRSGCRLGRSRRLVARVALCWGAKTGDLVHLSSVIIQLELGWKTHETYVASVFDTVKTWYPVLKNVANILLVVSHCLHILGSPSVCRGLLRLGRSICLVAFRYGEAIFRNRWLLKRCLVIGRVILRP